MKPSARVSILLVAGAIVVAALAGAGAGFGTAIAVIDSSGSAPVAAGAAGAPEPIGQGDAAGSEGPAGVQGAVGHQGAVGPKGAVGPQGPVGPKGAAGLKGAVGATGATGALGPVGPSGAFPVARASVALGAVPFYAVGDTINFSVVSATQPWANFDATSGVVALQPGSYRVAVSGLVSISGSSGAVGELSLRFAGAANSAFARSEPIPLGSGSSRVSATGVISTGTLQSLSVVFESAADNGRMVPTSAGPLTIVIEKLS